MPAAAAAAAAKNQIRFKFQFQFKSHHRERCAAASKENEFLICSLVCHVTVMRKTRARLRISLQRCDRASACAIIGDTEANSRSSDTSECKVQRTLNLSILAVDPLTTNQLAERERPPISNRTLRAAPILLHATAPRNALKYAAIDAAIRIGRFRHRARTHRVRLWPYVSRESSGGVL